MTRCVQIKKSLIDIFSWCDNLSIFMKLPLVHLKVSILIIQEPLSVKIRSLACFQQEIWLKMQGHFYSNAHFPKICGKRSFPFPRPGLGKLSFPFQARKEWKAFPFLSSKKESFPERGKVPFLSEHGCHE